MTQQAAVQIIDMTKFYWAIGALIVMNFGTIITMLVAAARSVWWLSELNSRVEQNKKDIHFAHKRIRDLKDSL